MDRQISLSLNRRPHLHHHRPRRQRGRAQYVSNQANPCTFDLHVFVEASTHPTVLLGLQDSVRQHIKSASAGVSARLQAGLIGAHEKLAGYFKKVDTSPFYMWAACERLSTRLIHTC
jgi:hypothetical protein